MSLISLAPLLKSSSLALLLTLPLHDLTNI
jgi:hypothetical protein